MSKRINSKAKGKAGELELVAELKRLLDPQAHRSQQYSGKGESSADVITPNVRIHWECKRRQRLDVYEAIEQADADADEDKMPIVAWRKNGKPWLVVMPLDYLPQAATEVYLALASDECEL